MESNLNGEWRGPVQLQRSGRLPARAGGADGAELEHVLHWMEPLAPDAAYVHHLRLAVREVSAFALLHDCLEFVMAAAAIGAKRLAPIAALRVRL